jgi:hypothetical protein
MDSGGPCKYLNPTHLIIGTAKWAFSVLTCHILKDGGAVKLLDLPSKDGSPMVRGDGAALVVGVPDMIQHTMHPRVHFWLTDEKIRLLPHSIENYLEADTVNGILRTFLPKNTDWGLGLNGLDVGLAIYSEEEGHEGQMFAQSLEIRGMFVDKKLPPRLYNLLIAHEKWEEVHISIQNTHSQLQVIIRKALVSNVCQTIDKTVVRYEDTLAEEEYCETDDEGKDRRSTPKRSTGKPGGGYETDYSIFGIDGEEDVCSDDDGDDGDDDTIKTTTTPSKTRAYKQRKNEKYQIRLGDLTEAYRDYNERMTESQTIINTFIMLEARYLELLRSVPLTAFTSLRDTTTPESIQAFSSHELHKKALELLDISYFFTCHTSERARNIIIVHDTYREAMRSIQDCFVTE